jgi:GNAT superfamily N-acetyltransferase
VHLRPATAGDVPHVAEVYLRSRTASVPAIPPGVHDDDDVRNWVATVVFPDSQRLDDHELWVAVTGAVPHAVPHAATGVEGERDADTEAGPDAGAVVAFMALAGDWIGHLYVAPEHTGHGIGTELLALAKQRRPHRLDLWTFESNTGARRFYERHGFGAVDRTDGDNEEGAPDVRYRWTP